MSKNVNSTKGTTQRYQFQNMIEEIYNLFDSILAVRLVQKISRPITNGERMSVISQFKLKFNQLHSKLKFIRDSILNPSLNIDQSNSLRNDQLSYRAKMPHQFKKHMQKIESKYIQLFKEGSFKHYEKIAKMHGLPQNIYLIEIQDWKQEVIGVTGVGRNRCCC